MEGRVVSDKPPKSPHEIWADAFLILGAMAIIAYAITHLNIGMTFK